MPISPSYEWEETEHRVEVRVSLPGASKNKSDVFATECMIKVNLSPYLLVLDLHGEVDASRTVATFSQQQGVTFQLFKKEPELWGRLEAVGSKEELTARRNASIDKAHAEAEEQRKARLERKQKEERAAVDRQIELERRKRSEIERRKNEELQAERSGINTWKQQLQQSGAAKDSRLIQNGGDDDSDYESDEDEKRVEAVRKMEEEGMPDHPAYHGKGWAPSRSVDPHKAIKQTLDTDTDEDDKEAGGKIKAAQQKPTSTAELHHTVTTTAHGDSDDSSNATTTTTTAVNSFRPLPPPRLRMEPVKVDFTALEMPHLPAREQREGELRAYKKSMGKDRALLADSADVADRQPVFLKDKGDALFKQGNYRGAIAAYSRAIELDDSIPLVWSNRAAAHAKLDQHENAAQDCTAALLLLRQRTTRFESGQMEADEVVAFKKQLIKVLVRRGAALAMCGHTKAALDDYEEAIKYDPTNEGLQRDITELHASLIPADAPTLKTRATARFSAGDHIGALEAFTGLLALLPPGPECVTALSNRAATLLILGRYPAAHQDCCLALAIALRELHTVATASTNTAPTNSPASETDATTSSSDPLTGLLSSLAVAAAAAEQAWGDSPTTSGASSTSAAEAADVQLHSWLTSLAADCKLFKLTTPTVAGATVDSVSSDASMVAQTPQADVLGPEVSSSVGPGPSHAGSACTGASHASGAANGAVVASTPIALVGSVWRLLARRGAVRGHMRRYVHAAEDFQSAAHIVGVVGAGGEKVAGLRADSDKMRGLAAADAGTEVQHNASHPAGQDWQPVKSDHQGKKTHVDGGGSGVVHDASQDAAYLTVPVGA